MPSTKTILIIVLAVLLLALLGGGGYYYYFEIFQPTQYATKIVPLYEKLASSGLKPVASEIPDDKDYNKALEILAKKKQEFTQAQQALSVVLPPKKMVSLQQDFKSFLEMNIGAINDAEKRANFLIGASELNETFKKLSQPELGQMQKMTKVSDIQKFFQERISKIQLAGKETFKEDLPEFNATSSQELKSSWDKTNEGLDFVLKLILSVNPNLSIEELGRSFSPAENQKAQQAFSNVTEFAELLEEIINQNSAYDILSFRYFKDFSQIEMAEKSSKLYQALQTLKSQYTQ